jgi:AraC-like DNA-binding protein
VTSSPAAAQCLRDLARLRRVRDRIDREYAQPLDVQALARGAHLSAGHLSRQFRLAYGESPYGYLRTRRIERAMALLRGGDLRVTEVCFAVGCSSLGSFSSLHRAGRGPAQPLPRPGGGDGGLLSWEPAHDVGGGRLVARRL